MWLKGYLWIFCVLFFPVLLFFITATILDCPLQISLIYEHGNYKTLYNRYLRACRINVYEMYRLNSMYNPGAFIVIGYCYIKCSVCETGVHCY